MREKQRGANQVFTSRHPVNVDCCRTLQRLWKTARKTNRERKKTGAKKHRLCEYLPYQIATGALMPGCGS
jgi:hypothetical protein